MRGALVAAGDYKDGRPWSGSFASRVGNRWRVQRFENGDDLQLRALKEASISELSQAVRDRKQFESDRWKATRELARRKVPSATPILIELLKDDYHAVRGSASWGLCQIGGRDAQDALLEYLKWSLQGERLSDLTRATEAQKERPDKRTLDLLVECLNVAKDRGRNYHFRYYAAEALGKIGDPKATLPLAQQLDVSIDYTMSRDYLYLAAIRDTRGEHATPILVDYLDRLVAKMAGQSLQEYPTPRGREARQVYYNFKVYRLTLSSLKAITGRKSSTGSREDVAKDWKRWWQEQGSEQGMHGKTRVQNGESTPAP